MLSTHRSNQILILSPFQNESKDKPPSCLPFSSLAIVNKYYHCNVNFINHTYPTPYTNSEKALCGVLLFVPFSSSFYPACLGEIKATLDPFVQDNQFQSTSKVCILVGDFSSKTSRQGDENGLEAQMSIRNEFGEDWEDLCIIDYGDPLESWVDQVKQSLECFQGWKFREMHRQKETLGIGFSEKLLADSHNSHNIDSDTDNNDLGLVEKEDLRVLSDKSGNDGQESDNDVLDETFQIISQIKDIIKNEPHNESDENIWRRRVDMADRLAKSLGLFDDD